MVYRIRRRKLAHLQPVHLLLLVVTAAAHAMRTAVHIRVDRTGVLQPELRRRVAGAPVPDRHEAVGISGGEGRKRKASAQHRRKQRPKKAAAAAAAATQLQKLDSEGPEHLDLPPHAQCRPRATAVDSDFSIVLKRRYIVSKKFVQSEPENGTILFECS